MKSLVVAAVLAAVLASPSFAQSPAPGIHHTAQSSHHHRAVSPGHGNPANAFGSVTPFGAAGDNGMSPSRASAIRECNDFANKAGYQERDSNMRLSEYRACMAQRGQPE